MTIIDKHNGIILFDGVCNFCNSSVNFIIRHDKKQHYKFAALQSDAGRILSEKYGVNSFHIDSIVLIENGCVFVKSSAILRITKRLNYLYPLLFGFVIVPEFIRDSVYDFIAKNRYKWFGKKESCMMPSSEIKSRFIS